jgi:hypothetical protein
MSRHGEVSRRLWHLALLAALLLALVGAPRSDGARAGAAAVWALLAVQGQPPPRSQFGMAIDGAGALYVYGGRGPQSAALADFWRLRRGDTRWQQLPNDVVPPLIEPHLAVDAAGNVFEYGGIGQSTIIHATPDRHSFGLYEYVAARNSWVDLTPRGTPPSQSWPQGREDHGFAYEPSTGDFYVFAGEGQGDASLNDMWRYDERTHLWTQLEPRFAAGAAIDAREIYNITPDNHGGIWLFGGAYLFDAKGKRAPWTYVNDLWRYDVAGNTWQLVAGRANAYDPLMPVPRHYYGQAADAQGNFYVLGGYVSDVGDPPYFSDDVNSLYAQVSVFYPVGGATGYVTYALEDFWQFSATRHRWVDMSSALGALQSLPFIPYVMVSDPTMPRLLTFGGYYTSSDGELHTSANLRTYPLPVTDVAMPPGISAAPGPAVPDGTPLAHSAGAVAHTPSPSPTRAPSSTASPTPTPMR